MPSEITIDALIERYQGLLIDAYGVLNDARGALPGAAAMLERIRGAGRRFLVVTNDCSRLPSTVATRLRSFGLSVEVDEVVTSGLLLAPYFERHRLGGARCMVLGTADSARYVTDAGGVVEPIRADGDYDAIIVGDDEGYEFLFGVEAALSAAGKLIERGRPPRLVLPNPDLIYPKGAGVYGFTSGAVALLVEAGLERRFGDQAPRFDRLGKPHAPIFDEARRRAETDDLVMIGDQLETDIAGARGAGLDAALLLTGVTRWSETEVPEATRPTYLLRSLAC